MPIAFSDLPRDMGAEIEEEILLQNIASSANFGVNNIRFETESTIGKIPNLMRYSPPPVSWYVTTFQLQAKLNFDRLLCGGSRAGGTSIEWVTKGHWSCDVRS